MKQLILKKIAAVIFIAGLVSCKKGSNNNSITANTKLLTQQEWKLSKQEEKVNSDPYADRFSLLPACSQDDKYQFKTNNTYEINEGVTKCNPSDPQVFYNGVWKFNQDETKIKVDSTESAINQLDNNILIISGNFISNPDTNYYRYTFVH